MEKKIKNNQLKKRIKEIEEHLEWVVSRNSKHINHVSDIVDYWTKEIVRLNELKHIK